MLLFIFFRNQAPNVRFLLEYANLVGTIAPAIQIPGDGTYNGGSSGDGNSDSGMDQFESSVVYFLTNVNLIVPVVAAVAVIVIAIAVICVLRGRNPPPPGFPKGTVLMIFLLLIF